MDRKTKAVYGLRVLLCALCVFAIGFIFYNSMQTGEKSSAQSMGAVEIVQQVASQVAPNSSIATATGKELVRLHINVRTAAHFAEFALLGLLAGICTLSFFSKKRFLLLPTLLVAAVAALDECLQAFVSGRAAEVSDFLADALGGLTGVAIAAIGVWLLTAIWKKCKKPVEKASEYEIEIEVKKGLR